jgi:hypothetical protein
MQPPYPPGGTPAQDPPEAPAPIMAPTRYIHRGGYIICCTCGLAVEYCRGHLLIAPAASDGSESGLARRIAEVKHR